MSAARSLKEDGYIVLNGVLGDVLCDALREHILVTTDAARGQDRHDLFGPIQEGTRRHDLKLDLSPLVVDALNCFGERVTPTLAEVVGDDLRIVELAAITSDSGAEMQRVHADTTHGITYFLNLEMNFPALEEEESDEDEQFDRLNDKSSIPEATATGTALLFTALVALQDVTPDMGPTHLWPATHTVEHHATLYEKGSTGGVFSLADADTAFGVSHKDMTLRKGDLVMYDSRVMHCGCANVSSNRRSVLCISLMGPGIRPEGSTWTMLDSLRKRLIRLSNLPLSAEWAVAPTNRENATPVLPVQDRAVVGEIVEGEISSVPPLEQWEACVQCTVCKKWRPCSQTDAPRLTSLDCGYRCSLGTFACSQDQESSTEDIDRFFS
jgi:ectoine hydroxylase-related dioxygenase (phytanoyl-CoA dioxygenase family)